jgi:hypothetical protein
MRAALYERYYIYTTSIHFYNHLIAESLIYYNAYGFYNVTTC